VRTKNGVRSSARLPSSRATDGRAVSNCRRCAALQLLKARKPLHAAAARLHRG
jgi:hypothetical protein